MTMHPSLQDRIDPMEPASIALNIINGNLRAGTDQILAHAHDAAEVSIITLLVVEELVERTQYHPGEAVSRLITLMSSRIGEHDTHRPDLRVVTNDD